MKLYNLINFLINNPCEDPEILKVILFIKKIMEVAFIVVPIVLIVLITFDFIKSVTAGNEDTMKKNQKIVIKRIVYSIFLFFVIPIVNIVFAAFGTSDNQNLISADFDEQKVSYLSCWDNAKGNKKTIEDLFKLTATFNENGGTLFGEKEKSCGGSKYCEITNLPRVTRNGYTFLGWSNDSCFTYVENNKIIVNKVDNKEFVACWEKNPDNTEKNPTSDSKNEKDKETKAKDFWWPIEANSKGKPKVTDITSPYGPRNYKPSPYHYGIDISNGTSPKIIASYGGRIHRIDRKGTSTTYGVYIAIKHSKNKKVYYTIYAHIKKGSIPKGLKKDSWVNAGDVIGTMGNTGQSTGTHLHFEIRKGGWENRSKVCVNPMDYVSKTNPYPKKTVTSADKNMTLKEERLHG